MLFGKDTRGPYRFSVGAILGLGLFLAASAPLFAQTVVRGPYLQQGTDQSVVVRWRTDVATKSRVNYGPAPGSLGSNVKTAALTTEHELVIDGLPTDTRFYYSVGTFTQVLAGDDPDHFFTTHPVPGSARPTRIWVLGDSGTANANVVAVRDAYLAYTGADTTDLWLMLGDNAYVNGTDEEYQAALFDMFPTMLRKSVLWPTIGNHEVASDPTTQTGPYFDMFTLPTGGESGGLGSGTEAYYSFDYANIHFVVLDSQVSDRTPGGDMLTWMESDLADNQQDWVVAFWHHSPYSKGGHDSDDPVLEGQLIDMREYAVPLLEQYGVDLVLTGHSHSYERSFLIDGHHGYSSTFDPAVHLVDGGDGREEGDGAYVKPMLAGLANQGAVYTVTGNAGQLSGGSLDHPAMFVSFNVLGSVVLQVDGARLDATFIDSTGVERDHFTIVKDEELVADFTAVPVSGDAPLAVTFTDLSLNEPTAWAWDFDDDAATDSTAQHPTHVYAQPGVYSVRLTVTGASGVYEEYKPAYVEVVLSPPVTDFSASPLNGLAPLQVSFTDSSTKLPAQWAWDFDSDGTVDSNEQHPTHLYAEPGLYTVTLTASNAAGSNALTRSAYVLARPDVPDEITGLELGPSRSRISWDAHPDACAYDLVTGDLTQLVSTLGDFSVAQTSCVVEDVTAIESTDAFSPVPGQPRFYLVRGVDCALRSMTYDTGGIGQIDTRDAELQGPSALCTCAPGDDVDGDGYCTLLDNCPETFNTGQVDVDADGFGDSCDNCPSVVNSDQQDFDLDGAGDPCDADDDADGVEDEVDACPFDFDNDADADGFCADVDNCPAVANSGQEDGDTDGFGNVCDCDAFNPACNSDCTDLDADSYCVTTDCDDDAATTFPGAAPNDSPEACMKDLDGDDWGDLNPPAGVIPGTDCDDVNAAVSPDTPWYPDTDGDGFGDPALPQSSCTQPAGYVADDTDCDDASPTAAATFPGAAPNDDGGACMKDSDGDDWGDASPPAGAVSGTDCDDDDAAINPNTVWYADADGDGFGDPSAPQSACTQPAGFVGDATDCDDASPTAAATFPGAAPRDDGDACMKDSDGDDWGDVSPPVGVAAGSDCDDADDAISPDTLWYSDSDADGFGDPGDAQAACTQPVAHVLNAADCDDDSATAADTFPGAAPNDSPAACMKDADADDWGDDTPGAGVASGSDCDDENAAINPDTVWYRDNDGDGFGGTTTVVACIQPENYVLEGMDCRENGAGAADTFPGAAPNDDPTACMQDSDGDDWGDANVPGGVTPGSDCNDTDPLINADTVWYADSDGDGFGDPAATQMSCLQPADFVADATDCDDTSGTAGATFPGAAPQDDADACMRDVDGDGWGDDTTPAGVTSGTDCDDTSGATFPGAAPNDSASACMRDVDGDDWGDDTTPAGVTAGTDCDDTSGTTFPGAAPNDSASACMRDVDGDDWGDDSTPAGVTSGTDCDDASGATFPGAAPNDSASACMRDVDGDNWGDDTPPAGVAAGTDCDDTAAATNPDTLWYADADGDGFGNAGSTQASCTQPGGHLADNTDCDDASGATFPGAAPNDSASACMLDADGDDWGDDTPPAGVAAGTDCDDAAAATNPDTLWYADADADGFGDAGSTQASCTQPVGHLADNTDCDDASGATFPGAAPNDSASACMLDADGDDWGDDSPPAGVTAGSDCDDAAAATNPDTLWYADVDGDGFGNAGSTQASCTQPAGHVLDNTDCDDSSGSTFPGAAPNDSASACMLDADGDDWGDDSPPAGVTAGSDCDDAAGTTFPGAAPNDSASACMLDADGDDWGDDSPPAGVTAGSDCDDAAAATNPDTLWYADADGDGFGNAGSTQASCTQPPGHLADNTDCDDTSAATFPGAAPNDSASACMRDADGDDWGDDSPPAGVTAGSDCDDAAAATNPDTLWYADADGDGFGNAGSTQASCTQPPGHLADNTDCDDTSAATFPGAAPNDSASACMRDADGDDWGDDSPPAGVTAGSDCDDTAAATNPDTLWYADADGDGFGNAGSTQASCTQPAGHLADDTDCDDASAATFPGAAPNDSASACMLDADGDDWGDDSPPAGVTAGSDCDDAAAATNPDTPWYADADGDGFGNAGSTQASCTQPPGHLADNTDCDDASAATFPGAAPNDSASACMLDADGDDWGDDTPPAGVTAGTDCDDTDSGIYPGAGC